MKRIVVLLATLLLLTAVPFCPAAAGGSFTGQVTYYSRSKREAYLQNGTTGKLARLDKSNGDLLDAVAVGKVVTVSGYDMFFEPSGYKIPEISDAMIESISDSGASAATVSATIDQLGNGLMAVRVRVRDTKAAFVAANIQLSLDAYGDEQRPDHPGRPYQRRTPAHAHTYTDPDTYAYSHTHTYPHTDANAYAYADTYAYAYTYAYSHTDTNTHAYTYSYSYANAYTDAHTDADAYTYAHGHTDPRAHVLGWSFSDARRQPRSLSLFLRRADRHVHRHIYRRSHGQLLRLRFAHRRPHSHRFRLAHRRPHSDRFRFAHRRPNGHLLRFAHRQPHGNG